MKRHCRTSQQWYPAELERARKVSCKEFQDIPAWSTSAPNIIAGHQSVHHTVHNSGISYVLMEFYRALHAHFGHRNWWPANSSFEVCVGAILTQNTAWKNVVKAIDNLKAASALGARAIYDLPPGDLAQLIRPAGYYNIKARRLRNFVRYLVENHGGELNRFFALAVDQLRAELLSVNGVGKETADSIILYAARKPVFVVDAYTKRVLVRHSLISEEADYDALQELFQDNLPLNESLFNDFHAQFVAVGHNYCKKNPLCERCPLQTFLPA